MSTHLQPKPFGMPTWTDLASPDPEASRKFYNAVFGWEYDIGGPEFGYYTTARLGNRMTAGISGFAPGTPADAPAAWGIFFASDTLGADEARAVELGANVVYPAMEVGVFGGMAVLQDPTGAQVSFWKAGTHVGWQVTNEPGAVAWHELYTPDAKKAIAFYTQLLHITAEPMAGTPGGLEYYTLHHGGEPICGIMQIHPSWGNMPAQWFSYFGVANTEESVAIVKKHGGQLMGNIDQSPWGPMAALRDPHGASFKIVQVS